MARPFVSSQEDARARLLDRYLREGSDHLPTAVELSGCFILFDVVIVFVGWGILFEGCRGVLDGLLLVF